MEPLSAQDASFLEIEDDVSHMHIGSVGIFEGPPSTGEELLEGVGAKLQPGPALPPEGPLSAAARRPAGVDRRSILQPGVPRPAHGTSSPGGEEELRTLIGRVMSQQLDRSKRLWEMWIAEGLGDGRWALLSKVHHCMVDGVSATDLLSVLLDSEREPARGSAPRWTPRPEPSASDLIAQPLARRLASPINAVSAVGALVRGPRQVAELAVGTVKGTAAMRGLLRPTPPSSLNGPIGPHRRWAWAHAQLSDVKVVRSGLGGTVNDVVLSAIERGFPRPAEHPRRGSEPADGTDAGAGVGAPPGRRGELQQSRLGDVRGAAGGDRGSGRAPSSGELADGAPQGLPPGGGR